MTTVSNEIKIVIGSWGSYNECNERALGSRWLDLADYSDWDEIVEELERQGFELDGIDEELFIQDIDNFPTSCANWDYVHPETLFNLLYEADVLEDSHKYDVLMAYLEVRSFEDFKQLVERYGSSWDDDIYLYKGYDWEDYGREMFDNMGYQVEDWILDYFDFKGYLILGGISLILHLFFTPKLFILGEIARQRAFLPRVSSATTRLVSKGFNPRSAHSTEA